jgi:glycosyltransferase involved in cell wall biosynthesis
MTDKLSSTASARLAYLVLEPLIRGQAAYTHTIEIINQLEKLGWQIERFYVVRDNTGSNRSRLLSWYEYLSLQARLIVGRRRFDALYVRSHPASLIAIYAARFNRIPIFVEVNGTYKDLLVTYPIFARLWRILAWNYRQQYKWATALFAVTPQLVAWVQQITDNDRVFLVPCAANTELFTPDGPLYDIGRPYVVFVGSLAAWHDIDTIIAALKLPEWRANTAVVIVGPRDHRGQNEAVAEIANNLIWIGQRPYELIPHIIRGALAALVLINNPRGRSDTGVLPIKLFEAISCGIPVIVTDLPGQRELVPEEQIGIVIPVGDAKALATAVRRLASNPEEVKRLGQNCVASARERHDWRHSAAIVDAVMRDAL